MLLIVLVNSLIGCATPTVVTDCPVVVEYEQEFEDQLANELTAAPQDAAWPRAMVDYFELRARLWECQ